MTTITWTQGQPLPVPQVVERYGLMAGTDCGALSDDPSATNISLSVTSSAPWCHVSTGAGYPVPVIATINPTNLMPGAYTATIRVIPAIEHRCGILEFSLGLNVLAPVVVVKPTRGRGRKK